MNKLPPCLLVLDNFSEGDPLRRFLPTTGAIHTLVTTRRRDLVEFPNVLLNTLDIDSGAELLNSGARKINRHEDALLVAQVGGLPLALELSKSFLNYRRDVSVEKLLSEMANSGDVKVLLRFAKQYRDQLPSGHETDVAHTFEMSWNLAPPTGQEVLSVVAELAPVGVPGVLIRRALELPKPASLDDPLTESLSELIRLSLVELDTNSNPLMHRLIRAFVRYRNQINQASYFARTAVAVQDLMDATFRDPDDSMLRELDLPVPHAEVMLEDGWLTAEDTVALFGRTGSHHRAMGRFVLSRRFMVAALERAEKSFEPGHPSIALRQSNLATVLHDLGQLEEARDLLKKALASDETSFEPGHPSIAMSQSNLALVLPDLGQLEEARDLLKKALGSNEKSFKPGHPSIASSQSNLGLVLRDLGQMEEARDLLEKVLASNEKSLEPGHPSIAISQSNLATALNDLGANGRGARSAEKGARLG